VRVVRLGPAVQGSFVSGCIGQCVLSTGFVAPGGWCTGWLGRFAVLDKTVVLAMSSGVHNVIIT